MPFKWIGMAAARNALLRQEGNIWCDLSDILVMSWFCDKRPHWLWLIRHLPGWPQTKNLPHPLNCKRWSNLLSGQVWKHAGWKQVRMENRPPARKIQWFWQSRGASVLHGHEKLYIELVSRKLGQHLHVNDQSGVMIKMPPSKFLIMGRRIKWLTSRNFRKVIWWMFQAGWKTI